MDAKSRVQHYGRATILLRWASARLTIAMIPLGFLMQETRQGTKLSFYRPHAAVGFLILLLTGVRLPSKSTDTKPDPTTGLTGLHSHGMQAVHFSLYALRFSILKSGNSFSVQINSTSALSGAADSQTPSFIDYESCTKLGLLSQFELNLPIAHIDSVVVHHRKRDYVFAPTGLGRSKK